MDMTDWVLPQIDLEKCVLCGTCVDVCPNAVLYVLVDTLAFIHPQQCTYCGLCEDSCPNDAIVCPYEIGWAQNGKFY
jgi:formate hydrogenlyase subunit 6/NADH:ubiquinone oxidoreductase subunit I